MAGAIKKIPRGLRVLITMVILAILVWRLAPDGFLYPGIGIAIVITAAVIYLTYRMPSFKSYDNLEVGTEGKAEIEPATSEADMVLPSTEADKDSGTSLSSSGSMLDYIKSVPIAESPAKETEETITENKQGDETGGITQKDAPPPLPLVYEETSLTEEDKTALKNAVWYRCENPYCKYTQFLDVHHIISEKDGGTNKLENLIVLCAYCHALADKQEIPEENMAEWVANREERFKSKIEWRYK